MNGARPVADPFRFTPFDPRAATADEWSRYHAFRRVRHDEGEPEEPWLSDDDAQGLMLRQDDDPDARYERLIAEHDHVVVGMVSVRWVTEAAANFESDKHIVRCGGYVIRSERRRGIGTAMARQVLSMTDRARHTVIQSRADEDAGHAFLRWLGFVESMRMEDNRLHLPEVDWAMVEAWAREGQLRSPASEVVRIDDRVPEDIVAAWCRARDVLSDSVPHDDLEVGRHRTTPESLERELYRDLRESRSSWHCTIARDPDGAIAGMTEVYRRRDEPDRIYQDLTGVVPDRRDRGLGKLLKARMLLFVRERYPEARWVITSNANSNAPMLAINRRLGFAPHRGFSMYQIARDALALRLGA